ncbi:MAG: TIGR00730 family Rossman fold protein [Gemmataceae bacterium]
MRVCVFCGSNSGSRREYASVASELGRAIAQRGWSLVYGGGNVGLMGVCADAVLAAGGEVIGVIPDSLKAMEVAHTGLTQLHVVRTMHERKAMMADLSDGFAALPGGFGTLDELFEILTWAQLGIHAKPVVVLNVAGFFEPLMTMLDHQVREGFLRAKHRPLLRTSGTVEELLDLLAVPATPPAQGKWLNREER